MILKINGRVVAAMAVPTFMACPLELLWSKENDYLCYFLSLSLFPVGEVRKLFIRGKTKENFQQITRSFSLLLTMGTHGKKRSLWWPPLTIWEPKQYIYTHQVAFSCTWTFLLPGGYLSIINNVYRETYFFFSCNFSIFRWSRWWFTPSSPLSPFHLRLLLRSR